LAESAETPANGSNDASSPSRVGRALQRLKPGPSALHVMGVLLLVSVALIFVASIAYGILTTRQSYFEQRNLRELDRIAAELTTARTSLAQTSTLHFVPQQLHFSLTPDFECLAATTQIMGERQQPIVISYLFTDPDGSKQAVRDWYARRSRAPTAAPPPPAAPVVTAAAPADAAADPAESSEPAAQPGAAPAVQQAAGQPWQSVPTGLCGYERPLSADPYPTITGLTASRLSIRMNVPLRDLLWPMTAWPRTETEADARTAPAPTSCQEGEVRPAAEPIGSLQDYVRRCLIAAATEDLLGRRDAPGHSLSYRPPAEIPEVIRQSVEAAFRSNTLRINVSTPTSALDFNSALEIFDAVQIIGTDDTPQKRPKLLYQAGRVPAANVGDAAAQTDVLSTITGLALPGAGGAARPAGRPDPSGERRGDFLSDSQIMRTGDLIIFQRIVPRLAGLSCDPCRIVGVVERSKFDQKVRKIGGSQATMFLIVILTLIALIPLLQLKLRKRLDATGRASQYLIWFALTLLAASASVSALAIWATSASRSAGSLYAHREVQRIGDSFRVELDQSLRLISVMGHALRPSDLVYPAPRTLPLADHLNKWGAFRTPEARNPGKPAVGPVLQLRRAERVLDIGWQYLDRAAIIDTVSQFRGDGFVDRNTSRIAAGRFPGYGLSIGDRPYFNRARNRGFDRIAAAGCDLILDRVLARSDGAPRVAFLLPRAGCGQDDSGASFLSDQRQYYDPTRQEFLLATATLRTFVGLALRPGFRYAVIDPHRPPDDANVLFHSRPDAELVERFQREIDDPIRFDTLVNQALADRGTPPRAASDGRAETPWRPTEFGMDTQYRASPSRLTVTRLHENMDWILVIVEDRNDAAFAVWRGATFGYAIWFLCVLLLFALGLAISRGRIGRAVDRRPGLSLWPRQRLRSFTPPLLQRQTTMQHMIAAGAIKRDRHMWWTLWACLIGLGAAEGGSRVLFAIAAATVALTARSYFRGLTTTDAATVRQSDRKVVGLAWVLLAAAAVAFVFATAMDFELRGFVEHRRWITYPWLALRSLAFFVANGLLIKCLFAAHAHTLDTLPARPPDEAGAGRRLLFWLRSWRPLLRRLRRPMPRRAPRGRRLGYRLRYFISGRPRADIGWVFALLILGGAPAAAGFLDSHDQDRYLVFDRAEQQQQQALDGRRREIQAIDRARLVKLPPVVVERVVDAPPAALPPPDVKSCVTLSCLAILSLDLREAALEYSDYVGFEMEDAFSARSNWGIASLLLLLLAPVGVLVLILIFFRREYFREPPLLSPGKDPNFDPPLSLTRDELIREALVPAAAGRPPALPFRPAGGNRHLILGVGLDLREDWIDDERTARLDGLAAIRWIDLLDPPDPLNIVEPAVVIGNLDLALQVVDQACVTRTFNVINEIAGSPDKPPPAGRQVFLLADIDPLDRISLLWERQGRDDSANAIEDWRWAALIQDFTLYPIRRGPALPEQAGDNRVLRTIREELGVLDTAFAEELCGELYARMAQPEARRMHDESDAEAERMVSFITEQMSDHYYKLWASSSDEERVMLYRVACECHLKMHDSRGLRSLLTRGLIVRTPEYRLMNRSFTRYVRRVGATSNIAGRARDVGGLDRIWPLIRFPLVAAAGSGVLLLQFVAPSAAGGAIGALPALVALLPAMLGKWFQDRTVAI